MSKSPESSGLVLLLTEGLEDLVRDDVSHLAHLLDDFRIPDQCFDPLVIGQLVSYTAVYLRQILGQDVLVKTLVVTAVEEYPVSHVGVEQRFEDREDRVKNPRLMDNVQLVYLYGKRGHHQR